jgi:hypothetical protein
MPCIYCGSTCHTEALCSKTWEETSMLAEEARRFGPMLDAMLLEARNLRLVEGHKARERTLRSLYTRGPRVEAWRPN